MTRRRTLHLENLEAREVPATAFALVAGSANTLLQFDTTAPGTVTATTPITGLVNGDVIKGIDFRPANGQLYGVGANFGTTTVQVYTIDPFTGAATPVGSPQRVSTIAAATAFGVDFNPVADRLRVVTDLTSDGGSVGTNVNNFRLNPDTGELVAIDNDLDFSALPGTNGNIPETAIAYSNSISAPAPDTTTLYGIAIGGNLLVTHSGAPSFSTLTSVGPLGVTNTFTDAGLDIYGPTNTAVAVLRVAGLSQLYSVDLTSGTATLIGTIGNGATPIGDIAVTPFVRPSIVSGTPNGQVQLLTSSAGQVSLGASVNIVPSSAVNVRSTTADVNGDGIPDIIAVTGPGTAIRVTVLSGVDNSTVLVAPLDPFGGDFQGGGFVTAADIDRDGRAEFAVTPDQGGGPRVTIFNLQPNSTTLTVKANFFGIDDANFRGGARGALGDVNGDSFPDLAVAAGFLGGPRTALFNGTTLFTTPTRLIGDFFAFPGQDTVTLRNGVFVSISDINGDGSGDLVFGGGPGGSPRVFILSGAQVASGDVAGAQAAPIANFFVANNSTDRGGVRVAAANVDGDLRGDLIVGSGEGSTAKVRVYRGVNFTTNAEPTVFQDLTVFNGAILAGGVFVG